MPLSFSDLEVEMTIAAAGPIPVENRAAFLVAVANEIDGQLLGAGSIHRAICRVQRQFLNPPRRTAVSPLWSKKARTRVVA